MCSSQQLTCHQKQLLQERAALSRPGITPHKPFLILAEKELKGFKKILLREKNTQIKSIKVKNITSISLYNLAINYNFYSRYFR